MLTRHSAVRSFSFALFTLLLVAGLCACTAAPSSRSTATVTFNVPVPVEAFSPQAALQVSVWNARQLEQLRRQAECVVSHDVQTGNESVHCPDGVQYQAITPEQFVFPLQGIKQSISVTSQTVKVGEPYQIALRGLSSDDCNSTSATAEGTAAASTITLGNLEWATTDLACIQP
jgi:hypothetical protein